MTQEALTNIVKHAHAQHASVARGGMGMVSLRARAASIGAEVHCAGPGF